MRYKCKADNILTQLQQIKPKFILGTIKEYDPLNTHKNVIFFDIQHNVILINGQCANRIDEAALTNVFSTILENDYYSFNYYNDNISNNNIINNLYNIFNSILYNYRSMGGIVAQYYDNLFNTIQNKFSVITDKELDEICK